MAYSRGLLNPKQGQGDTQFKELVHQHTKKFLAPKGDLVIENLLETITPRSHVKQEQVKRYFQKKRDDFRVAYRKANKNEKADITAKIEALNFWEEKGALEAIESEVDKAFVKDFYGWLNGAGNQEDHEKTPWNRQRIPDKEVQAYLRSFTDARYEFAEALEKLIYKASPGARGLEGIGEFYLYFKYIIRGAWHDSGADFLHDYTRLIRPNTLTQKGENPFFADVNTGVIHAPLGFTTEEIVKGNTDIQPVEQIVRRKKIGWYDDTKREAGLGTKLAQSWQAFNDAGGVVTGPDPATDVNMSGSYESVTASSASSSSSGDSSEDPKNKKPAAPQPNPIIKTEEVIHKERTDELVNALQEENAALIRDMQNLSESVIQDRQEFQRIAQEQIDNHNKVVAELMERHKEITATEVLAAVKDATERLRAQFEKSGEKNANNRSEWLKLQLTIDDLEKQVADLKHAGGIDSQDKSELKDALNNIAKAWGLQLPDHIPQGKLNELVVNPITKGFLDFENLKRSSFEENARNMQHIRDQQTRIYDLSIEGDVSRDKASRTITRMIQDLTEQGTLTDQVKFEMLNFLQFKAPMVFQEKGLHPDQYGEFIRKFVDDANATIIGKLAGQMAIVEGLRKQVDELAKKADFWFTQFGNLQASRIRNAPSGPGGATPIREVNTVIEERHDPPPPEPGREEEYNGKDDDFMGDEQLRQMYKLEEEEKKRQKQQDKHNDEWQAKGHPLAPTASEEADSDYSGSSSADETIVGEEIPDNESSSGSETESVDDPEQTVRDAERGMQQFVKDFDGLREILLSLGVKSSRLPPAGPNRSVADYDYMKAEYEKLKQAQQEIEDAIAREGKKKDKAPKKGITKERRGRTRDKNYSNPPPGKKSKHTRTRSQTPALHTRRTNK